MSAEQNRIRRLFAALDDISGYSGNCGSTGVLAQTWARIADLVLGYAAAAEASCRRAAGHRPVADTADQLTAGLHEIHKAVRQVGAHDIGAAGWWLAVRDVAQACEQSAAAWSAATREGAARPVHVPERNARPARG